MRFSNHIVLGMKRRAAANVGDAVDPAGIGTFVHACANGVNPGGRTQKFAQVQVGGGKTQLAASGVAVFDPAFQFERAAQNVFSPDGVARS